MTKFGSHSNMVVNKVSATEVVCKDEYGVYLTKSFYLDRDIADPNRFNVTRMSRVIKDFPNINHYWIY